MGGRPGYADEKPYGRFAHRSAAGYQNGILGMLWLLRTRVFMLYHIHHILSMALVPDLCFN